MDINWESKLFALIGDPVEFSLSPKIHNKVFEILEKNASYMCFKLEEDKLEEGVKGLKALGVQGFNVTIPHKETIINYLDGLSKEAEEIAAVNTVKLENGSYIGYNTDGRGFIKSLLERTDLANKNLLLIGAGGASLSLINSLKNQGLRKIFIKNRTKPRAQRLIDRYKDDLEISLYDDNINKENIDIIVNASSLGMYPLDNKSPISLIGFKKDLIVYDLVYKPRETKLIKEAKSLGMETISGYNMLINQALLSQEIWWNQDLDQDLYRKIREEDYV